MSINQDNFSNIVEICQKSPYGKRLPDALYLHVSTLQSLEPVLQSYELLFRELIPQDYSFTLIKFNTDLPKISYLFYPDFETDPHPALVSSVIVNLETQQANFRDYSHSNNPPILHRKETFVASGYPYYFDFVHLTQVEEALGLLDNSRSIGTRSEWEKRLRHYNLAFEGHYLVCPISHKSSRSIQIDRHKAAIPRKTISRPVRLALEAGVFQVGMTFFDYGCGYGRDIQEIESLGHLSSGWDPFYAPNQEKQEADIVNLGYVINVIEDVRERREALLQAWELTRQILIVSAQVLIDDPNRGVIAYGDGIITSRNTFQKYFEQEELKAYIDQVLQVDSVPIGLGIYLVFRNSEQAQTFQASRFRSRAKTPTIRTPSKRFEDYERILTPLMEFYTQRGRLPAKGELSVNDETAIKSAFGNLQRAFQVVLQATQQEDWDEIREQRRQELLLYLALGRFGDRPSVRQLASEMRQDIKDIFGGYEQACVLADMLLYSLRDLPKIAELCRSSQIGKKFKNSFVIHIDCIEKLPTLLRLYEGCASRTVGRLEGANVVKFALQEAKISYLTYADFDEVAHPLLQERLDVYLGRLRVSHQDYQETENPPILHEKDLLVGPDYPLYEKFAQLSQKERDRGLLDDYGPIRTLRGWEKRLEEYCSQVKGHQLFWRKDCDAYKLKFLQSQTKARQRQRSNDKG